MRDYRFHCADITGIGSFTASAIAIRVRSTSFDTLRIDFNAGPSDTRNDSAVYFASSAASFACALRSRNDALVDTNVGTARCCACAQTKCNPSDGSSARCISNCGTF